MEARRLLPENECRRKRVSLTDIYGNGTTQYFRPILVPGDPAREAREQRGLEIAATKKLNRKGDLWTVPSSTGHGAYVVDCEPATCTCPDFELRREPCKHVYAVEFTIRRQATTASGTVTETITYRQEWSRGGNQLSTYRGPLLVDVSNAVISSFEKGGVEKAYEEQFIRAMVIVRAVAKVGIIALIGEATGYEKKRAANSLAQILEAFIAKELQPWVKTFPDEYYSELFRLRNLPFPSGRVQRPQFFGHLTNDIIYRRLAPGVLDELKRVAPKNAKGKRSNKLWQMLSASWGYRKLLEHMGAVVTMMQLSTRYEDFKKKLDQLRPIYGSTLPLPFAPGELDDDNGVGL